MSTVAVEKMKTADHNGSPIFEELGKRMDEVRRRAFDFFEKRGREIGHEVEDWLKAERDVMGWPVAEMAEKDGAYELEFTLPGYEAKDIQVTATPAEIVIHAAAEHEKKAEQGKVLWTEYRSNDVCRRFEMPSPIELDRVSAKLDKGILHIKAPKSVAVLKKEITVAA